LFEASAGRKPVSGLHYIFVVMSGNTPMMLVLRQKGYTRSHSELGS
jgi:hypothetical protein